MQGLAAHWTLDPTVTFLNHGSFGACPRAVLAYQSELRARLESEPVRFMVRELEAELDISRDALARFIGADPAGLAFVRNATEGVNTVLASFPFTRGDAVITTDHAYGACKAALDRLAAKLGLEVIVAQVPFPIRDPEEVTAAVLGALKPSVKLALLDHVTSPTALVFPIESLVRALEPRGVACLIDGAHAPGMIPLSLDALAPSFYTGNCHKWLCTPKGAALLWVRADRRSSVHPLVTSHGASASRTDRSRFHLEFDWTGTDDPTAFLSVKKSIEVMESLVPGGWPKIMEHNHRLALEARALLAEHLGVALPAPESMIGSIATLPLPDRRPGQPDLSQVLFQEDRFEVPMWLWPAPPKRIFRVAAQLYNTIDQYQRLAEALMRRLQAGVG
ncbi:MAG: aminotransferase class V-fold PLP-dependent enzyme [Myxococcota bacterium]